MAGLWMNLWKAESCGSTLIIAILKWMTVWSVVLYLRSATQTSFIATNGYAKFTPTIMKGGSALCLIKV